MCVCLGSRRKLICFGKTCSWRFPRALPTPAYTTNSPTREFYFPTTYFCLFSFSISLALQPQVKTWMLVVVSSSPNPYLRSFIAPSAGDYDDMLEWPFKLKHKIQILDHYVPGKDLSSRIWDPKELCSGWNWKKPEGDNYECVGLGFPQETVQSRHYLHNDSITIKLTVFID